MFRHQFRVIENVPDVVLEVPWLESYNPTAHSDPRCANVPTYGLFSVSLRDSTRLQFQPTLKLQLFGTLSSNTSKPARVETPTVGVQEHPNLKPPRRGRSSVCISNGGDLERGLTDEELSNVELKCIWVPKLKQEIPPADLIGDQLFLSCKPRLAVPVGQLHKVQHGTRADTTSELEQVCRKLPS